MLRIGTETCRMSNRTLAKKTITSSRIIYRCVSSECGSNTSRQQLQCRRSGNVPVVPNLIFRIHNSTIDENVKKLSIPNKYFHTSTTVNSMDPCQEELEPAMDDEVEKKDAFAILNLPREFSISEELLKSSYKQLIVKLHPDKHTNKLPAEQVELENRASAVTDAYQILRFPHTRAFHLLDLITGRGDGKDFDEGLFSDISSNNSANPELLMEVMEIREDVDSIEFGNNEQLKPLLEENRNRIEEACELLDDAFKKEDIETAKELACKLQYWYRIDETIREKMD